MPIQILNPQLAHRPGAFLDRDGVLNVDQGYGADAESLEWIPGTIEAVRALAEKGFAPVIVTNQSGIARGFFTEAALLHFHEVMAATLAPSLAAIVYCPHATEDDCNCRKPKPGMLLDAQAALDLVWDGSFLVGDRDTDVQAAQAAGIPGLLFEGPDLLEFLRDRGWLD